LDVVEPFTENPLAINDFAKGKPSQPQPKILMFFIIVNCRLPQSDCRLVPLF
jgi:hypothetical protein